MSRTLRRLIPSPAMIVALVALVVSLGGSGYAQRFVPLITGEDIVNNSVTSADIRNTSLTRKDIRKRSLRGRKFELNSVGGRAIKESRLETVPSAGSARGLDLWAAVRPNGRLARGRDMGAGNPPSAAQTSAPKPTSTKKSPGRYEVTFCCRVGSAPPEKVDVRNCSYLATIGGATIPNEDSQIAVSGPLSFADRYTVYVRTGYLRAGTPNGAGPPPAPANGSYVVPADRQFQIAVIC